MKRFKIKALFQINKKQELHHSKRIENLILDYSSTSSNTGSAGTKQTPSAQQLAEVSAMKDFFHYKIFFLFKKDERKSVTKWCHSNPKSIDIKYDFND